VRLSTQLVALLLTALLLGACGFHLRGNAGMSFNSLYLEIPNPKTPFAAELRHALEASQVKLASSAEQADVVLDIVSENSEKQILTLSSSGRVTEFRLIYRVSLRAYDHKKQDWIPPEEMKLYRDLTYDDTEVLAKEAEEATLVQSMHSEMAQQIIRRLSRAKPQPQ